MYYIFIIRIYWFVIPSVSEIKLEIFLPIYDTHFEPLQSPYQIEIKIVLSLFLEPL